MPKAVRKRRSTRQEPYVRTKARRTTTGKRVAPLASGRLSYDNAVVEAPSVGLGQSSRTRLRTYFHAPITLSATGQWKAFLKPGSVYDPTGDVIASVLQPNLFDQWKQVYDRYVVLGATVKISLSSQGFLNGAGYVEGTTQVLSGFPSVNAATKTGIADYESQPYAKKVVFCSGGNPVKVMWKLDHKKVLGRFGQIDAAENGSLVTSDPAAGSFMVLPLMIQSSYTNTGGPPAFLEVEIVQDVWFDKRKNLEDVIP